MTHDRSLANLPSGACRAVYRLALAGVMVAAASGSALAQAGQPPERRQQPRRQETIEIRGQVPTPQVVTVRPREAPAYSRRVLVPAFLDRDFWPSILPPLHIVTPIGTARADSTPPVPADSARRSPTATPRPAAGIPPAPPR
jgi:hypothetical protein